MAESTPPLDHATHPWLVPPPDRLIGRGHPAGDFLEAWDWRVVEEDPGRLVLDVHLPDHVRNPRGQLFGGFTPTYVDLVALFTVRAGPGRTDPATPRGWLATTTLRVDYFEPIVGPRFTIDSTLDKRRGRTCFVTTRFLQDGELVAHAVTTLREVSPARSLGDA
jgi:acyl-coenzyme A thioesterase PaaI-like protein